MSDWKVVEGDCLERLREMADVSVHCCITSPPYFGLRDYGNEAQIGLEATPDEYVAKLVEVFREIKRVLRDDGTLWLNLGDSYNAYNGGAGAGSKLSKIQTEARPKLATGYGLQVKALKPKDLLMIPARVALALQADGWTLRSEIIWAKPNPMPESVTDRPTKAHEQVFLLSKSPRYYYDAPVIAEPIVKGMAGSTFTEGKTGVNGKGRVSQAERIDPADRNKRSVWTVATQPYPEAHFATFPPKLIEPMILAGCPREACATCGAPWERQVERTAMEIRPSTRAGIQGDGVNDRRTATSGTMTKPPTSVTTGFEPSCACNAGTTAGVVLDPFAGAGTTLSVAEKNGRSSVGIELNPEYVALICKRLTGITPSMFDVSVA